MATEAGGGRRLVCLDVLSVVRVGLVELDASLGLRLVHLGSLDLTGSTNEVDQERDEDRDTDG